MSEPTDDELAEAIASLVDFGAMQARLNAAMPMDMLLEADEIATAAHKNMRAALRVTVGVYYSDPDDPQEADIAKPVPGVPSVSFPEGHVFADGRVIDEQGELFDSPAEYLEAIVSRYTKTQLGGGRA